MTNTQQTDLDLWLKDTSQELPASLDNLLIEDCLEELANNEKAKNSFDNLSKIKSFGFKDNLTNRNPACAFQFNDVKIGFISLFSRRDEGERDEFDCNWQDLESVEKQLIIQTFLSRTPDGAVMPFLDVKLGNIPLNTYLDKCYNFVVKTNITPQDHTKEIRKIYPVYTLDHLLYREFTEALRIGKTLDEALKIINKIYILNRYV